MTAGIKVSQTVQEWSGPVTASDLNPFGILFGGRMAALVDQTAGHSAYAVANGPIVTIAINEMQFLKPVFEGAVLTIRTAVNRVFETSMEVGASVWVVAPGGGAPEHVCRASLTFVAVDERGEKLPLRSVIPETEDEKQRYKEAGLRREARLALQAKSGKS